MAGPQMPGRMCGEFITHSVSTLGKIKQISDLWQLWSDHPYWWQYNYLPFLFENYVFGKLVGRAVFHHLARSNTQFNELKLTASPQLAKKQASQTISTTARQINLFAHTPENLTASLPTQGFCELEPDSFLLPWLAFNLKEQWGLRAKGAGGRLIQGRG